MVTGATGTIGKALIKKLVESGAGFKAAVRDSEKGRAAFGEGVELAEFDFSDPASFDTATEGIDRVFLLGPPMVLNLDSLLIPFIDHLKAKGINRVVYLAALKLEEVKELPFHEIIIEKLRKEGFDYTVLKPSFFAQNFKNYEWENITQRGITYAPAGTGKVGFIDINDIANAAATVLTTEGHSGREYELTGPECLSYQDAAELLSQVTGKKIVYPNPSPEEYTQALKAGGAPDFIAPYMISVYSLVADGKVDLVTGEVERITGKKPTPLKEVLHRDFA